MKKNELLALDIPGLTVEEIKTLKLMVFRPSLYVSSFFTDTLLVLSVYSVEREKEPVLWKRHFISASGEEWLNFNCDENSDEKKLWSKTTIENIYYNDWDWRGYHKKVSYKICSFTSSVEPVCKYLGIYDPGKPYELLESVKIWQKQVLAKRNEKRKRTLNDKWDSFLKDTRPYSKGFQKYVEDRKPHFLFYKNKKSKTGFCTFCKKEIELGAQMREILQSNKAGKCPECGHAVTFKDGHTKYINTGNKVFYYLQSFHKEDYVLRCFEAEDTYWIHSDKKEISEVTDSIRFFEFKRVYYTGDNIRKFLFSAAHGRFDEHRPWIYHTKEHYSAYGQYSDYEYHNNGCLGNRNPGWCDNRRYENRYLEGEVYVERSLKKQTAFSRTGCMEWMQQQGIHDCVPEVYLTTYRKLPFVEQLSKAGYGFIADECLSVATAKECFDGSKSGLDKQLGLDRFRMKRLKELGSMNAYRWLLYEKKRNANFRDEDISYLSENKVLPKDLDFIMDRMTVTKIRHYIEKQVTANPGNKRNDPKSIVSAWKDYLAMAQSSHMNIENSLICCPKNVLKMHDTLLDAHPELKDWAAKQIVSKFGESVNRVYATLNGLYAYEGKDLRIVMPENITDILREGFCLGHCVARTERYYSYIENNESYLVFLRKNESPDTPWYTLEIEPDGTVRQKRTTGDRLIAEDVSLIMDFIREWQRQLRPKLTEREMELARKSENARKENIEELRKNGETVRNGILKGRLLADVLSEDLIKAAYA